MTQLDVQVLALTTLATAILAGALALVRRHGVAASLNGALAALFLALQAPGLLAYALNQDAYVRQYGEAALAELPLLIGGVALALMALLGSVLTLVHRPVFFWLGWFANVPTVAMLLYLAFWFHIF